MTRLLRDVEVEFGYVRGDGSGNAHLAAARLEDVLKASKGGSGYRSLQLAYLLLASYGN